MRLYACLLAVAAGIVTPAALAKGPDRARICGAAACTTVDAVSEVNTLALYTSGFEARAEPSPAPFFTVELTSSVHHPGAAGWSFLYVPSARALKIVRADFSGGVYGEQTASSWISLSDEALAAYRRATPVMAPFPANPEWAVTAPTEGGTPWSIVALAVAGSAIVALLLLTRRRVTRRFARLAHD